MQEDFFYEFLGFHGIRSICHLRILAEPKKPVVVVCSQVPGNPGTSVQNAYEIIRDQVYQYLSSKQVDEKKKLVAQTLDDFAKIIVQTKKFSVAVVVFLIKQVSGILKNEKSLLDLLKKKNPPVVWLEHWPAGTGLSYNDVYFLVSEKEAGSPQWERIDIGSFAKELDYTATQISIPEGMFTKPYGLSGAVQ